MIAHRASSIFSARKWPRADIVDALAQVQEQDDLALQPLEKRGGVAGVHVGDPRRRRSGSLRSSVCSTLRTTPR